MKKNQLFARLSLILATTTGFALNAQAQGGTTIYNTISGTVWNDQNADGIMDPINPSAQFQFLEENPIPGVLVKLTDPISFEVLATAIAKSDGSYVLNNYHGTGNFKILFDFPTAGFEYPLGGTIDEYAITIASPTNITNQNIGLTRKEGYLYAAGMKDFQSTDYVEAIEVSQYPFKAYADVNPSYGLSGNPTIWLSQAVRNPLITATNQLTTPLTVSEIGAGGKLTSNIPGVSGPALQLLSFFYVQNVYLGGSQTITWSNFYSGTSSFGQTNLAGRANYNGNSGSTISIPINAQASVTMTGGSNVDFSASATMSAGAIVLYPFNEATFIAHVLPIKLSSFTAKPVNEQTLLDWSTAVEVQNSGFEIERSTDGKTFSSIGFVSTKAEKGTSSATLNYNYTDARPQAGMNIYRLKQIDQDGKTAYSKLQEVKFSLLTEVSLYPNPARTSLNIVAPANSIVNIYDVMGRKVLENKVLAESNNHFDISSLPNGNYSVQIINGSDLTTKKLTIRK